MKWFSCIAAAFLNLASVYAADSGTTSANFLKLGVGPRAIAMGEAQVGLADDVFAMYWNPAGLAQLQVQEAGFTHTQHFQDVTEQYAAYAYPHQTLGAFAASATFLNVSKFDGYDAAGQPTNAVGASDTSLSLGYARPLWKNRRMGSELLIGASAKYIQEKLASVTASAYAVDGGLLVVPGKAWGEYLEGWRAGFCLRNLGTPMQFDSESFPLPRSLNAGLSWTGEVLGESIIFTMDGQQPNDGKRTFGTGVEVWTLKTFVIRGGYTSRGDLGNGLRLGAGIRFRTLEIGYAYLAAGDLGQAHRIGLTLRFGKPARDPQSIAEEWYLKGLKEYKKQRYTEALVDFNKALEIDPSHPQALEMMNKTYEELKVLVPSQP
ncbi:MAG: PorV/PorQ family protein [Elusimicrobiota bacterium]